MTRFHAVLSGPAATAPAPSRSWRRAGFRGAAALWLAGMALLAAAPCAAAEGALIPSAGADADLDRLCAWLSGGFSSAEQARGDSAFHDIRLHVVPIWRQRGDGLWLYVEQARAGSLDRPYRQRVYRLARVGPDLFESRVYTLQTPLRFAGAWRTPDPLDALLPDSLSEREGCSIILRLMKDGSFAGSTLGTDCASDLRGALYATSEVRVTGEAMRSWDRGYDAEGRQVWGAEKGPYVFLRSGDSMGSVR